jgi:hypothetical protein
MARGRQGQMTEVERLTKEYNAAVANGLVMKARRIGRVIDTLKRGR